MMARFNNSTTTFGTCTEEQLRIAKTPEAINSSIKTFSFSKISLWYECAQLWSVQYIAKIRSPFTSPAVKRGEQLHEYYELLNKNGTESEEAKVIMSEFKKKYPIEALKFIKNWLPHRLSLPSGPNEAFEKEIKMDFVTINPARKVVLNGYIDYLNTNDPNNAIIIDYKSGTFTADPKYADQAAIYALSIFTIYPKINRVVSYLYDISDNLERTVITENSFEFIRERDQENLMRSLSMLVSGILTAVDKGTFLATPCRSCFYCPLTSCRHNKSKKKSSNYNRTTVTTTPSANTITAEEPAVKSVETLNLKEYFGFSEIGEKERTLLAELKAALESKKEGKVDEPVKLPEPKDPDIYS